MPCINTRKSELFEIQRRFPEHIEKIKEWESLVAKAAKRGGATFFPPLNGKISGIEERVAWSKTTRGGVQYDLFSTVEAPMCSSSYGLCE